MITRFLVLPASSNPLEERLGDVVCLLGAGIHTVDEQDDLCIRTDHRDWLGAQFLHLGSVKLLILPFSMRTSTGSRIPSPC